MFPVHVKNLIQLKNYRIQSIIKVVLIEQIQFPKASDILLIFYKLLTCKNCNKHFNMGYFLKSYLNKNPFQIEIIMHIA